MRLLAIRVVPQITAVCDPVFLLFLDILDYWPRTGCHPVVGKKAPGCGDNRDERSCAGIGLLRRWRKFRWGRRRIDSRYAAGHLRSHPNGDEREDGGYYGESPSGYVTITS